MMNDKKEHHLYQLFVKLGHELEQIRQRALSNLIVKLDNGLISLEELANEKYLHVRLLEWFNFPSWPLSKEVLLLIKRLIQYQIALESFVELNAIQFLMQLKVHLDEETQSLLDEILISLKSVSNVQTCNQQRCVFYSKSERRQLSDEVSTSPDEATFTFDSYASMKQNTYQNISFISNDVECSHYCFNKSHFPWVSLTAEDKFVLDSSVEWLSSANVDSCNVFIADVLLRDFPAEVFLQRPQIIKALMEMVSSKDASSLDESGTRMLLESVSTLSSFCHVLSSRVRFHDDLDFYAGTQTTYDDDLVPRRRPMREEADRLDVSERRRPLEEQWSVQEFCLNVLERVIPLLSGLDMMIYSKCLRLVSAAAKLLKDSIDKRNFWRHRDHHHNFKQRILSILKQFSTIMVSQHRSKSSRLAVCEVTRRQTFFVGLADAFVRLVDDLVDLKEAPVNFQQDCFSCFELLQQEVFLEFGFPGLHERIESLLSTTNHVPSQESIRSNELTKSLRCCCRFLNSSLKDEKQSGDSSELIDLAEQGLMSIHEHRSVDFIECSIKLIAKVCSDVESGSSDVERCRKLLLRLLACSDVALQTEVYEILRRIIKGTLNIEKFVAVKSDLKSDLSVLDCLLDVRIFYEIIAFGFSNLEMKIQETSKDVLLHLLQSKILLTETTWNKLMTCLQPLAPLLHSYGDESSLMGKFILGMFGDSSVVNVGGVIGKELETVKGNLRIMFHKDVRLRKIGLSSMIRSLMCEENGSKKSPQLSSADICQQNDIFLLTFNFGERWNYYNYNIYKESDLKKVMKNFASFDKEAKISSSSQMSTMLCDPSLHKIFVSCNGLDLILNELQEGLLLQKNLEVQLISNLFKCLLSIVLLNSDACERLSRDVSLYLVLLRYAIVFSTRCMVEPQVDVTVIVFLLLFQHSARLIVSWHKNEPPFLDESTIRIPAAISSRYCIPFGNHGNYCESSPWATTIFSESLKSDEKTDRKMSERMRVVWNVELCDGDSTKACLGGEDEIKEMRCNASFNMSDEDKELLRATVPSCGISFALSELEGAQSHFMASRAILRISTFLSFQEADECLLPVGWTQVLEKFVSVAPSSPSDFLFLKDVIGLLKLIAIKSSSSSSNKRSQSTASTRNWMVRCLLNEAVLVAFSCSNEEDKIRRGLPRKILQLMNHLLASTSSCHVDNLKQDDGLKRLLDMIILRMSRVEATNSWQLSFLQNLLMVLCHVTARSGWSSCDANLCDKVLQLLLKTCVFFHEGRSGIGCSYVGRGVTRYAALCLGHVALEMANNHHSEEWAERWHHSTSSSSSSDCIDSGLEWLFTLITYRDVEVCISGLSVATTLSSSEAGRKMLIKHTSSSNFQNIWDAALHLLIDEHECHFVCKQAASLVLNLMTHLTNNNSNESCQLQSLFVHDRENNVKLVGLPCLTYLLRETKFYEMFASMLNSFTFGGRSRVEETRTDGRKTSNNANNNSLISDVTEDVEAGRGGAINQPRISPILLASLFDLLHNMLIMAPSDTMHDLHRHQLVKHILRIFSSSLSTVHQNPTVLRSESKFFVADLLHFLSSLVEFLCLASNVNETTFAAEVLRDVIFLKHLPLSYAFLKASAEFEEDDLKLKSAKLMNSCFNLLTILLNSNVDNSFQVLTKVCDERWSLLKEALLRIISDASVFGSDLWFSGVQFVALFANRESLLAQTNQSSDCVANNFILTEHLNRSDEKDAREFVESMVGMVKSFDFKSSELLQHKMLILDAFKVLSSISSTFRMRAFRAGILNIFMDDLQRTSSTLSTDFDSVLEKSTHKKAKTVLREVQKTIEALQSLMVQIPEAKMSACRRDLAGLVASLWKWCLNSASLMSSVLSLLTCFTAHSSEATSSLVNININKHQAPTCSVFVCLLKFTQKEFSAPKKGNLLLLKAFQLLGNLVTNSGCRSILAKSTFLTETASLIKSRNKKQISQTTEEILWLKFLAGLSFFGDGQLMILKIEDILSILLDQGAFNFMKTSCQLSALTIRNLCFHPNNRAKLLSNDKVVSFILKCLNEESDHLTSVACSALLVLLTGSQKLKVHLKNNVAVMKRLQDLLEKQGSKSEVLGKFSLRQSLQDMITIIDG